MLITIKNLEQQVFKIEIEDSKTVKELKMEIEMKKGSSEYPSSQQKLIYAGKILNDESTLASYSIDQTKFVVVMVTKSRVASTQSSAGSPEKGATAGTETSTTPSQQQQSQAAVPRVEEGAARASSQQPASTDTPKPATTTEGGGNTTDSDQSHHAPSTTPTSVCLAESNHLNEDQLDSVVRNIMDLGGYTAEQVRHALHCSFNNPDRAVEYLLNGIPASLGGADTPIVPPSPQPPTATTPHTVSAPRPAASSGQPTGTQPTPVDDETRRRYDAQMEMLRAQPQFELMRQMMRANPALLSAVLQQFDQANPELMEAINANPEQFLELLNTSTGGAAGGVTGAESSAQPTQERGVRAGSGGGGSTTTITVSTQERDAIERLKQLGFAEDLVVQVYFACNKDENQAANILCSQEFDD